MSIAEAEPAQVNPLTESAGLSPEQESERARLKQNHKGANEDYQESLKATAGDYGYLGFVPRAVDRAMYKGDEKAAVKVAAEHYKANEGSYQEQAVKDVAAEDAHTNFGT